MCNYDDLKSLLREMGGVLIGYSGGVDSTLLAQAATDALGEKAVCVIVESDFMPKAEVGDAISLAAERHFNLIRLNVDVLSLDKVPDNEPDRCYHCKKALFGTMLDLAGERKLAYVLDGANIDDDSDYRPGSRAVAELGVRSPLKELGFTKANIREMSKAAGLPTWDRPSLACLASRVPYGTRITAQVLERIEKSESALREMGFRQFRVRHHGDVARIELTPDDLEKIADGDMRNNIVRELKAAGYQYVSLDLSGYRTGSLNETLKDGK